MHSKRSLLVVAAAILSLAALAPAVAASGPGHGGQLHVTKECSEFAGQAGGFCTITSSNVDAIKVGSKVVYASAAGATSLVSDITIVRRGHTTAYGHVFLDFATGTGTVTLSGGAGEFRGFSATAVVTYAAGPNWAWDGTYSFRGGQLHVTKECSEFTGLAGGFCTITSSNVEAIKVGSKVVYASAAGAASLVSDITIVRRGHTTAYGHVFLDFATGTGTVTLSGGAGEFRGFSATAVVTYAGGVNWAWDGTYSSSRPD
jgi:hypothetical protein